MVEKIMPRTRCKCQRLQEHHWMTDEASIGVATFWVNTDEEHKELLKKDEDKVVEKLSLILDGQENNGVYIVPIKPKSIVEDISLVSVDQEPICQHPIDKNVRENNTGEKTEPAKVQGCVEKANARNQNGDALHEAARKGLDQEIKALLKKGLNVDSLDMEGNTPLFYASNNGQAGTAVILLKYEANVNHKSNHGFTALMHAAWKGHVDLVSLLIAHGADVKIVTAKNYTALCFATLGGFAKVSIILRQADNILKDTKAPLSIGFGQNLRIKNLEHNVKQRSLYGTTSLALDMFFVKTLQNRKNRQDRKSRKLCLSSNLFKFKTGLQGSPHLPGA
ncbi:ankyrin repeat domain-containing protein 27-like isoform X1 [Clytia hemisphaerica]|uniref:Uncharacterized protein n=1 Tax=Clytia hemisphaerica TaxID=252671 RepID=A0A7M5V3L0_9CNID